MNFLPGWGIPLGALGKSDITLTKVLESSGAPGVVLPSGIEAGDLIVLVSSGQSNTEDMPDMTNPSGFTVLASLEGEAGDVQANRSRIYAKVAAGNEDGTTITPNTDSTDRRAAHCLVFRPSQPIVNLSGVGATTTISRNDPGSISIAATPAHNLVIALYGSYDEDPTPTITTRSMSPTEDGEILQDSTLVFASRMATAVKWRVFNPPGSAVLETFDIGDEGTSNFMAAVGISVTQ